MATGLISFESICGKTFCPILLWVTQTPQSCECWHWLCDMLVAIKINGYIQTSWFSSFCLQIKCQKKML